MKYKTLALLALATPLALVVGIGTAADREPAAKEKPKEHKPVPVAAISTAMAPVLDGSADDPVWKKAPVVKFQAVKGINFAGDRGKTNGTIQAAYDKDMLYMLVTYEDPTYSVRRSPFQKQADGSWVKLKDPDDKGGDNSLYYEDKLALIWNIDDSILGFNDRFGCQIACHGGEPGKPYGNKYTEEEGELGDIWHLKYVRGGALGQMDDQYLDHTRFDAEKSKDAGRKSDPKTGGGYEDVKLVAGQPEFMSKSGLAANKGGTYWIAAADKVPFDDARFVAGDEVASIVVDLFTGDRGDIKTNAKWDKGVWTIEIARKLVTDSKVDVNFSDLTKPYGFGLAAFDNAQVRHATVLEPLLLQFK